MSCLLAYLPPDSNTQKALNPDSAAQATFSQPLAVMLGEIVDSISALSAIVAGLVPQGGRIADISAIPRAADTWRQSISYRKAHTPKTPQQPRLSADDIRRKVAELSR